MMDLQPTISRTEFVENIQKRIITLTPSQRLADALNREAATSLKVWETYPVYTLSQFINSSLERAAFAGIYPLEKLPGKILKPLEEQIIWEEIINKFEGENPLSNFREIAKYARQAWYRLNEWCIDIDKVQGGFEFAKLKLWLAEYKKTLQQSDAIDQITNLKNFCKTNLDVKLINSEQIQFAGFTSITPLFKLFVNGLKRHNIQFSCLKQAKIASKIEKTDFADIDVEITAMAGWCASIVNKNPQSKIAIIVPELARHREQISRALTDKLQPEIYGLEFQDYGNLFNISLGRKLINHDIVGQALGMLEIIVNESEFDYQLFSSILTSRNFYSEATQEKAQFDLFFRENSTPQTSLAKIVSLIKLKYHDEPPEWAAAYIHVFALGRENFGKKPLTDWAQIFSEYLEITGFATRNNKSFIEYQILLGFGKALTSFAKLHTVTPLQSASSALRLLKQVCTAQIFQIETSHEVKIEVMSVLDISTQVFDYLWFIGADADTLPAGVRPNPLLPISLQKQAQMPYSSFKVELKSAMDLISRLRTNASFLIFSSSKTCDGKDVLPSGLIRNFLYQEFPVPLVDSCERELLEELTDYKGTEKTKGKLKSAVSFLQDQALCPLMAYAIHRLGSRQPPVPQNFLSPLRRGRILHKVLEKIYTKYKNPVAFQSLSHADSLNIIRFTLKRFGVLPKVIGKNTVELEVLRTSAILHTWLELDKSRQGFAVKSCEAVFKGNLNGFDFYIRIDRLDLMDDGSQIIIDYKTGLTNKTGWLDARLTEPQLPLYAISLDKVGAIAFAEIRPADARIKYLGKTKIVNAKNSQVDSDVWRQQLNVWRSQLDTLTDEISQGFAALLFDDERVILNSEARGFCRVQEQK